MLPMFFLVGIIFIPLGVGFLVTSNKVSVKTAQGSINFFFFAEDYRYDRVKTGLELFMYFKLLKVKQFFVFYKVSMLVR